MLNEILASCGVFIISSLIIAYSIFTYPIYAIIQQPWKLRHRMKRKWAYQTESSDGICYQKEYQVTPLQNEMMTLELNTLAKVFLYACEKFKERKAQGARIILGETEEKQKDGKMFKKFDLGDYKWSTFSEMKDEARYFGKGLRSLGLKPHSRIVIFAETRKEWFISAMGSFLQNMTICTLYSTLGEEGLIQGFTETEVTTVVTSSDLLPKIIKILPRCRNIKHIVYFQDPLQKSVINPDNGVCSYSFEDIVSKGSNTDYSDCLPDTTDPAIIMYTSGSTGKPKGVVLSHENITTAMLQFSPVMTADCNDIYLAYLPLAHVLELMGECVMLLYGVPMGYSSALTLTDVSTKIKKGCPGDATILKPTTVPSVPLILDRIYKAAHQKAASSGIFGNKIFNFFVNYKIYWMMRGWQTPLSDRFIFARMKNLLGGKVKNMGCGGAPLSPNTQNFIRSVMGINVCQGYGLTETSGCGTMMDLEDDYSTGRVGTPLPFCHLKLIDWEEGGYTIKDKPNPRGEIVVGGKHVSVGYFNNPDLTKESFYEIDGVRWFRTGDIGEIFTNGTFKIIDRKKDLVKLQTGEYISLGKVEAVLKLSPYVDNVCVCANSSKNNVVAIVSTNEINLEKLRVQLNVSDDDLYKNETVVRTVLQSLIDAGIKGKLTKWEIPAACYLAEETWNTDNKLLTATMKLSRRNIEIMYKDQTEALYKSL